MYVGGSSEMVSGNLEAGSICLWLRFYLTLLLFGNPPPFSPSLAKGGGVIFKRGEASLKLSF